MSAMKLIKTRWFFLYHMMNTRTPMQPYLSNSLAIRQEIQRFESVHPSIYAIYDLIDAIPDHLIQQQIREHVVCIEGRFVSVTCMNDRLSFITSQLFFRMIYFSSILKTLNMSLVCHCLLVLCFNMFWVETTSFSTLKESEVF